MTADLLDLVTAATPAESVDVLVTWVGGVTIARYRMAIARRHIHSPLERRASFLVSVLAVLLLVRGVAWLRPDIRVLGTLMIAPAALLPMAMTIFVEGLLRRHVPRAMKWLALGATSAALGADVLTYATQSDDRWASGILLGALVVTMTALTVLLARRDTASLSRSENGLVRACLVVALVGLPLLVTDFRFVLGAPPARLGTLSALLFCYTLLRPTQERGRLVRWVIDVARLVWRAALACTLLLVALRTAPRELFFPLGVLATTLVMSLAIHDRISHLRVHGANPGILRWLARPPVASMEEFQRELRHLTLTADALVVTSKDLTAYNQDALRGALAGRDRAHTLAEVTRDRALGASERGALAMRGSDELSDLLERARMTHVVLLCRDPLSMLLANVPELPGHEDASIALAAIARRAPTTARSAHAGSA